MTEIFTPLHRALGMEPGPITSVMLDDAIDVGVREESDLDWKAKLFPTKNLQSQDFPKDIAAMANSGGGLIVFGIREDRETSAAKSREGIDTPAKDQLERAYRTAAYSAISPPVRGIRFHWVDDGSEKALALEVPASPEIPHLVFRDGRFGVPVRFGAQTEWCSESQIEQLYRDRFDERQRSRSALDQLFDESRTGRDTNNRAWFIAVARPRTSRIAEKLTRQAAQGIFSRAKHVETMRHVTRGHIHIFENVDHERLRPGLRRWVAPYRYPREETRWHETWAAVHFDGSVSVASAIGAQRRKVSGEYFNGGEIDSEVAECYISDFMSLLRAAAQWAHMTEYDVRIGVEWTGQEPLKILGIDGLGRSFDENSTPLHQFSPIELSINALSDEAQFHSDIRATAKDFINQGGLTHLRVTRDHPLEPR